MPDLEPYENTLSIDEWRREVRECWDREHAIVTALLDLPEMAPPRILLFLSKASEWPADFNLGKELQHKLGSETVPYKTECETGPGMWFRMRQAMMAPRPESVSSDAA